MVEKHLPDGADIHGGGVDLRFPHHENELAQSAAAHPEHTFVRAWAHHGMVTLARGKMAKSVGNVLDVEAAVKRHGRNALRMWLLQSHYSQPIDYSEEILEEKRRSYERLLRFYRLISSSGTSSERSDALAAELLERFDAAMRNDLGTPEVIADLFEVSHRVGGEIADGSAETAKEFASLAEVIRETLTTFGFDVVEDLVEEADGIPIHVGSLISSTARSEDSDRWVKAPPLEQRILDKVSQREQARQQKDWAIADALRDELQAEGWAVEDTPEGPILSRP